MSDPDADPSNAFLSDAPPPLPSAADAEPASSSDPKPIAKWRWWVQLLIMVSYPPLIGYLSTLAPADEVAPALSANLLELAVNFALAMGSFFFFLGLAWVVTRVNIDQLMLRWKRGWVPWALGLGYSVAMRFIIGIAVLVVVVSIVVATLASRGEPITMTAIEALSQEYQEDLTPNVETLVDKEAIVNSPLYLFLNVTLVSFVMAGFREELWRSSVLAAFKGIFPNGYEKWYWKIVFVLIIAIAFGVGHWNQGISGVFMTGGLGVMLGMMIVFHRSVWEATLAHGFFNATSFILMHFLFKYPELFENLQENLSNQ